MNGLRRQAFNRFLNDASGRQYTMRTRLKTLYLTSVLMTLRGAAPLAAQSTLQITSPSNGAILNPGQMLSVTVNASGSFQVVTVLGEGTIGFGQQLSAPPYQFSTQIPARASAGIYKLTAVGANSTGQPIFSVPTEFDPFDRDYLCFRYAFSCSSGWYGAGNGSVNRLRNHYYY
jgi:hypothetical protein